MGGVRQPNTETSHSSAGAWASTTMSISQKQNQYFFNVAVEGIQSIISVHTIFIDIQHLWTWTLSSLCRLQHWAKSLVQHCYWTKSSKWKGEQVSKATLLHMLTFRHHILLLSMGYWFTGFRFFLQTLLDMCWFLLVIKISIQLMEATETFFGKTFHFRISYLTHSLQT